MSSLPSKAVEIKEAATGEVEIEEAATGEAEIEEAVTGEAATREVVAPLLTPQVVAAQQEAVHLQELILRPSLKT